MTFRHPPLAPSDPPSTLLLRAIGDREAGDVSIFEIGALARELGMRAAAIST
jgi:hypothetical protein